MQRLSVRDAARALGLSEQAIRSRIHRGTIDFERTEDGGILVMVPEDFAEHYTEQDVMPLVEALQERIQSLERQLERAEARDREGRRLLAAALERIPAIEAPQDTAQDVPSEPREAPQTVSEPRPDTQTPPEEERRERSWWRRLIEG